MLKEEEIAAAVERLAEQISNAGDGPLCIVGIRSRGDEVAERVCNLLAVMDRELHYGLLDISLYRDDLEHLKQNPKLQSSEILFPMEDAHVILIDDVLFTGRTIRAALDALTDYGRPQKVELAVLIDRGWRELPIHPNYVGVTLETERLDRVIVNLLETDGKDLVELQKNDSQ